MPSLRVKLFQDGADLASMIAARERGLVSGYTTNPTLMRKAGIAVTPILTRAGASFVTPLSLSALAEAPVRTELLSLDDEPPQLGQERDVRRDALPGRREDARRSRQLNAQAHVDQARPFELVEGDPQGLAAVFHESADDGGVAHWRASFLAR